MSTEDQKLLVGLQAGKREAAEELVRRLEPMVTRVVFRLTGWHDQIQDVVQDTFLAVQVSAESFRGQASLETWVYGIALNCCRSFQRNRRKHFVAHGEEELVARAEPDQVELQEHVQNAIAKLEQEERELIVMRYLEELSLDELSELLQIRKNTLEVKLHRARKKLASLLQEHNTPITRED